MITERELQNTLLETCDALGIRAFHVHDSRRQVRKDGRLQLVGDARASGYPDLTIIAQGGAIWAELKSEKGKLNPDQVEWLESLPPHRAHVWRGRDLDLAIDIIRRGHPPGNCPTCWTCSRENHDGGEPT